MSGAEGAFQRYARLPLGELRQAPHDQRDRRPSQSHQFGLRGVRTSCCPRPPKEAIVTAEVYSYTNTLDPTAFPYCCGDPATAVRGVADVSWATASAMGPRRPALAPAKVRSDLGRRAVSSCLSTRLAAGRSRPKAGFGCDDHARRGWPGLQGGDEVRAANCPGGCSAGRRLSPRRLPALASSG